MVVLHTFRACIKKTMWAIHSKPPRGRPVTLQLHCGLAALGNLPDDLLLGKVEPFDVAVVVGDHVLVQRTVELRHHAGKVLPLQRPINLEPPPNRRTPGRHIAALEVGARRNNLLARSLGATVGDAAVLRLPRTRDARRPGRRGGLAGRPPPCAAGRRAARVRDLERLVAARRGRPPRLRGRRGASGQELGVDVRVSHGVSEQLLQLVPPSTFAAVLGLAPRAVERLAALALQRAKLDAAWTGPTSRGR
mmetsp:Transcript_7237/g.18483  ORF Transcript_7237/g.18483 Transcript_7237/m.18483 type:complete len:249 (-) Transcript_7237:552-1298(-)